MEPECQLAFLNWVAYHPTSNKDLSCPLTGCSWNDFQDFESKLRHVAKCTFLPPAKYWCASCNREESFAAGALRSQRINKDHKHGKDSNVRDVVVSFFKPFGRKKDLSHNHEVQADALLPRDSYLDNKLAIDWPYYPQGGYLSSTFETDPTPAEICTMNDRGSYVPISGELPTAYLGSELLGAVSELPTAYLGFELLGAVGELPTPHQGSESLPSMNFASRIEMSGTRSYINRSHGTDSDNHNTPTEYASASSQLSEQWSEKAPESPHSALVSPEPLRYHCPKSHSYHHPSTFNDSITDMDYCETEQRWGKVSGTSHVLSPKDTSLPSDSESDMPREQSNYDGMRPRSRPDLRLDTRMVPGMTEVLPLNAEAIPNPSAVVLSRQEVCHSLPQDDDKQNSVEELFQIVAGLEDLWAQKLKAAPELASITSHLHSASALQGGLEVLRKLFESNINMPRTMEHLFQFMHIAFACAYKSWFVDRWYPWEALYEDVLRWSQIIAEPEDRDLYLQVADLLWSAPERMTHPVNIYSFQDWDLSLGTANFENGFASHTSDIGDTLSTSQLRPIPFEEAYVRLVVLERFKKGDVLVEQLRNGNVVKSCARFLDGTSSNLRVIRARLSYSAV